MKIQHFKINVCTLYIIFIQISTNVASNHVDSKCVRVSGTTRTFDCIFQDIANDRIACVAEKHECRIEKSSSSISLKDGFRSVRITLHITKFDTEDIKVKICRIVESDDSLNECEHKDSSILLEQMVKIKYPVDVQISCSQLHESTTDLQQVYECSAFSITPINRFDISCESGIYCQLDSDKVIENTKEWPIIQTRLTVITTEQSCPKTDHPVIIKIKNEATNVDVQKSIPITTRCTGKRFAVNSQQEDTKIDCRAINEFARTINCSITSGSSVKEIFLEYNMDVADYTTVLDKSVQTGNLFITPVLIKVKIIDIRETHGNLSFKVGVVTEAHTHNTTIILMNIAYTLYPYELPHINCTRVPIFGDVVEYDPSWKCRLLKEDNHLPNISAPKDYTLDIKNTYRGKHHKYLHFFTVIFKSNSKTCSSKMALPTIYKAYNSNRIFAFSDTINCQKFSASCHHDQNGKMLECRAESNDMFSYLQITCGKYILCNIIPNVNTGVKRQLEDFKVMYELKSFTPNMHWVLTIHAISSEQGIPILKHLKFPLKKSDLERASLSCEMKKVHLDRDVNKFDFECLSRIPRYSRHKIIVQNEQYSVSNTFVKVDKDKITDVIKSDLTLVQDKSLCHQTETLNLILGYVFEDMLYETTYEITINPTCIDTAVNVKVSNADKMVYVIVYSNIKFSEMNITCSSEVNCSQAVDVTRKNEDKQSKTSAFPYFVQVYKLSFTTVSSDVRSPLTFKIMVLGHDITFKHSVKKEIDVTYIPNSSDSEQQISCSKVSSNPFEMWINCEIMSTHQEVTPVFENDYHSECQKYISENSQSLKLSVFKCRLYSKIPKCSDSQMIITYKTESKKENEVLAHTTMTYQSDCDYFEMNECVSTDEFGRSHNCIIKSISHTLDLFCEAKHMICKIHTEQLSHSLQLYQWRVFIELISAEIPIYIIDDPIKVMVVRKNTKKETGKSTFEATLKLKPEEITSESCSQKELVSTNNLISFECVIISRFPLKFEAINQSQYNLTPVILNQTTSGISLKVIVSLQITSNDLHLLPHKLEYLVCDSRKDERDEQCLTILLSIWEDLGNFSAQNIQKFVVGPIAVILFLMLLFSVYKMSRRRYLTRRLNHLGDRSHLMEYAD